MRIIYVTGLLLILFTACAFAQAKPLDPVKDYAIGPFKPGDAWNRQLAEKYFGKPLEVSKISLSSPRWIKVFRDKVIPEHDPRVSFSCSAEVVRFNGALFVVLYDKIVIFTTTEMKLATSRGLHVGDSLEKVKKLYPSGKIMDCKNADCITYDKDFNSKTSESGLGMRFLIFVDVKTKKVSGLAFHSVELPRFIVVEEAPKVKPSPKATPSATPQPGDPLTDDDFKVGPYKIGEDITDLRNERRLIPRRSIEQDPEYNGFNQYFANGIDISTRDDIIWEFHCYSQPTFRGLRINDSLARALELYGEPYSRKEDSAHTILIFGSEQRGIYVGCSKREQKIVLLKVYDKNYAE